MSASPGPTGPPPVGGLGFDVSGRGGRTLVLMHGLGGDRRQLLPYVDAGIRRDCDVIAVDLRGHGSTRLDDAAGSLTFTRLAADVEELLAELRPGAAVVLVGVSMGCGVALELAVRGTLAIDAMLLVRPAWRWTPNPPNLAPFVVLGHLLQRHRRAEARRLFQQTGEYAAVAAVSTAAAQALLAQFDEAGAGRRAHRLIVLPADAPRRPPAVPPTRVLAAGRGPVHPRGTAEALAADLGADLTLVPPRYDQPGPHRTAVTAELAQLLAAL